VKAQPDNALSPGWARGYTDSMGRAACERCFPTP
jgi:hypothetical protein